MENGSLWMFMVVFHSLTTWTNRKMNVSEFMIHEHHGILPEDDEQSCFPVMKHDETSEFMVSL